MVSGVPTSTTLGLYRASIRLLSGFFAGSSSKLDDVSMLLCLSILLFTFLNFGLFTNRCGGKCHVYVTWIFFAPFSLPLPLSLLKKIELCHHRAQVKGETVYLVPPGAS